MISIESLLQCYMLDSSAHKVAVLLFLFCVCACSLSGSESLVQDQILSKCVEIKIGTQLCLIQIFVLLSFSLSMLFFLVVVAGNNKTLLPTLSIK